ncbi:autotransporter beta-domain protein [Leptotrichia trevisanii]|uniref:Autotransporter beta-domain protein n=1 Tax=Leptotrichia trevisanii TaxID=109328 RepID=A0A510KL75_9FUSO|nr:autotransporter-associated N-terminal domain-containing protein [Leptotrichia trevisanii]BBM51997.1 autotransporter beta-domain protein [Leptotrichia trevisanii]
MTNNLKKISQELRAFAKRTKDFKYIESALIMFLMTGMLFASANIFADNEDSGIKNQVNQINTSINQIRTDFKRARKENSKLMKNTTLELTQLMEQGDHVVKSPWSSWQYGINYFNNNWNGTYKGRGDKEEKYPYEGIFERSTNAYERYVSPESKNYSLLGRNRNPRLASSNNRQGLSGYGIASTLPVNEPIVAFEVSAGINPRVFTAPTVTPLSATQPNLPEAINFVPPEIATPSPNPSVINIVTVNLTPYSNGWGDVLLGLNSNIGDGTHVLSSGTSPGSPGSGNADKKNAISEYVTVGNYTASSGAVMDIDVSGRRAVTLDPTAGGTGDLKFTNSGTINLISANTGGIEVQTHNNSVKVTGINGTGGTINGKADNQIAMVFTDEGNSNGIYTLQNDGQIIMNGNGSMGYGLKIDTGWIGHALNSSSGTITMNGDNSYGIGIGTNSLSIGAGSSAKNAGTINIAGKNSGGIAIQKDMTGGIENTNTGIINVYGENSFGMYSEVNGVNYNNNGTINITGSKDKSIGLRVENSGASLTNKKEINISSTGTENIGMYSSKGTVTNDSNAKITVTAGENIGMMAKGMGQAGNVGTITVTSDGATGAVVSSGGHAANSGTITVTGKTSSSGKGIAGIIATGGSEFTTLGSGVITANVSGKNSVGIYAKDSNSKVEVLTHNTTTADGAVNYAVDSNGVINLNGVGTASTGAKSLLFYNNGGKINITQPMTATISGGSNTPATRGTAFLYQGTGHSSFTSGDISTWATSKFSGLSNLTLNMNSGSRLFIASDVGMNLSDTTGSTLASALGANITGSDYKTFMLYNSLLTLNQSINLDDTNDAYNQLELSNSSIDNNNNNTITGTQTGQTAIAQENLLTNRAAVTINNNGIINLSGANSTGMYAKYGIINNNATGTITLGDTSTGLYGIGDSILTNTGTITMGSKSTAMYSEGSTTQGVTNAGTIISTGTASVGVLFKPAATITAGAVLGNTGNISLGDNSVGLYGENTATNYTTSNSGNITVGQNGIGMFGYAADVTGGTVTVGNKGVGVYSQGGNVNLTGGTIATGASEAVGVYTVGSGQTITNSGTAFNLGDTSVTIANAGNSNTVNSTVANVGLGTNNIYVYSSDAAGTVNNSTNLSATGSGNYGIYSAGIVTNSGNMDFGNGVGNVGIYSVGGGTATNTGTITIGGSNAATNAFGIGMAAGYQNSDTGNVINNGTINVNGDYSIGMYASGAGSTATNNSNIVLNGNNTTGIYADNGATAINTGNISTGSGSYSNVVGVYLGTGATLNNTGTITINGSNSVGVYLKGGRVVNYGNITVNGNNNPSNTVQEFTTPPTGKGIGGANIDAPAGAQTATVTINGVKQTPVVINTFAKNPIEVSASSIGMYVNTSGKDYTKSINGLGNLTQEADLIIGTEATEMTNSKSILIKDPRILGPYNNAIKTSGVSNWNIYSGGLNWLATPTLNPNDGTMTSIYMVKIPYTAWAGRESTPVNSADTYNFLDGLEQRYGVEALDTRERKLFQKLNGIGNNEAILFYQATDEMMGHQYGNLQQRINTTGNLLDKEFRYLKHDWRNPSKQNNKIKVFGMRDEYNTDTAGIINYTSNAYGVAYVHEDEKIKMGNSSGWYAGAVTNRFKFKDIGKSKENQTILKAGVFKTMSPKKDYNGALQWTIGGDVFVGINDMKRRYLVVDEVFQAKSDYHSYGAALKTDLGYDVRLSERTHFRPYGALKMEYGRFNDIKEDRGEMRLEVKGNDYFSVKPEVGMEFKYVQPLAVRTNLTVGLTAAYENELGKVGDVNNRGRVRYTTADWFGIRGEKDDRKGNGKFDLNIGVDNTRFGVTVNGGYDTKGKNVRAGIGFRAIY